MGIVSTATLSKILSTDNYSARNFAGTYNNIIPHTVSGGKLPVTAENAAILMDHLREYVTARGHLAYKALRPWEINPDLYAELDQDATWWGWEFETGYTSKPALAQVVGHVWDTWTHVCFDSEGEGNHFSEITFAPAEMQKFTEGKADAYQFMQYISDNRDLTNNTGYSGVGTHLNFSTPAIRNSNSLPFQQFICDGLNNTLHMLPIGAGNPRMLLFGRNTIYGGAFGRGCSQWYESNGRKGVAWIECKMFRTTYTIEEYDQYVKTATGMMKCVEALEKEWNGKHCSSWYVKNFVDVVMNGAEPALAKDTSLYGDGEGWYVSGEDDYDSDYGDDDDECHDPTCETCYPDY
jgi:hypothetical protein